MSIMASRPSPHAEASLRRRLLGLFSVCLAALLLPMSFSGGAVATPAIGAALHGSALEMRWITSAFMLAFGGCLMAAGACADAFGRKRIFLLGVGCLLLTSLALALSRSALVVDWLRALQGVAAAATLAGGGASLAQDFDGHARARAYGLLGTTFGVGLAFGPLLAGVLIARFGWQGVFGATAVVAALALIVGACGMRESRDPAATGLDWPGALSFTGALACFTYGVIQAPALGATAPEVLGALALAGVLAVAFVAIERRVAHPMLDLSLFRYVRFIGVQMLPIATSACYIVLLVLLPLRFIGVHGDSEVVAGLRMMALSLPMLVVPFIATQLARRLPAGVLCSTGLVLAAGLAWLARTAGAPDTGVLSPALWPMLLIGTGSAMPWGLMDGLSVSVVPTDRAGMAPSHPMSPGRPSTGSWLGICMARAAWWRVFRRGVKWHCATRTNAPSQRCSTGSRSSRCCAPSSCLPASAANLELIPPIPLIAPIRASRRPTSPCTDSPNRLPNHLFKRKARRGNPGGLSVHS